MPEQPKGDGVASNALKCEEMRSMESRHVQVVALRIQGKRWSEIAAIVGVVPQTICRWREEHPEIDRAIQSEANDYLVSSRHMLATLLPLANARLAEALQGKLSGEIEAKDVIAANKLLAEVFKAANTPQSSAPSSMMAVHPGGTAKPAVISDAELERVLDVELSEPDQREPTQE